MPSLVVIATAIAAFLGFLSNCIIFYLVMAHRQRFYHYLFAAVALICIIWDLSVFLQMLRNQHIEELDLYGRIATVPAIFIPALVYHFTALYTSRVRKWELAIFWLIPLLYLILIASGLAMPPDKVHQYAWGNMFASTDIPLLVVATFFGWFIALWPACYFLYRASQQVADRITRRHHYYLCASFFVISIAILKMLVTLGVDVPFLLVMGMVLNDLFAAIIGIAIIKEKLFDITVIVKKGAIYSALAGLLIFVFSFTEHVLITYFGELIAGHSQVVHFIAIGLGILVLMPVKHRLEGALDRFFARRVVEF